MSARQGYALPEEQGTPPPPLCGRSCRRVHHQKRKRSKRAAPVRRSPSAPAGWQGVQEASDRESAGRLARYHFGCHFARWPQSRTPSSHLPGTPCSRNACLTLWFLYVIHGLTDHRQNRISGGSSCEVSDTSSIPPRSRSPPAVVPPFLPTLEKQPLPRLPPP